jgi:hypothetical protein
MQRPEDAGTHPWNSVFKAQDKDPNLVKHFAETGNNLL